MNQESRLDGSKSSSVTSSRNRLIVFIASAIGISVFLVFVSVSLYFSSGTNQLDLSLPQYRKYLDQYDNKNDKQTFPSTGPIDKKVLQEFLELYDKQADQVLGADSFKPGALSDSALELPEINRSGE